MMSIDLQEFFSGVDEMQVYLDRHKQDPEHRQERVRVLSRGLPRNHGPRALAAWFSSAVQRVLGATSGAFYAPYPPLGIRRWFQYGETSESVPTSIKDGLILRLHSRHGWPIADPDVEVQRAKSSADMADAPRLAVWGTGVVDELTVELLQILAGTVAASFERATEIEKLAQDTAYSLPVLLRRHLLDQAAAEIGVVPAAGTEHLLVVVDAGDDGGSAAGLGGDGHATDALRVAELRELLPVGTTFGRAGDRWIAVLGNLPPGRADEIVRLLRAAIPNVRHARYRVGIDDLNGAIEKLYRHRRQR